MPYALEVIVALSAWLMRSTVRCFGGGSIVVRAVLHLASLVRWLDSRCAPRHLLRSKVGVSVVVRVGVRVRVRVRARACSA